MDFEDTPEEAEFRREVSAWLAQQAPHYDLAVNDGLSFEEQLSLGRKFQSQKAERGYA